MIRDSLKLVVYYSGISVTSHYFVKPEGTRKQGLELIIKILGKAFFRKPRKR